MEQERRKADAERPLSAVHTGERMLLCLLLLACPVHLVVAVSGTFFGVGDPTTWKLEWLFSVCTLLPLLSWRRLGHDQRRGVVFLIGVLVLTRWTYGWLVFDPSAEVANLVSGLLYVPLLIACGVMLGTGVGAWVGYAFIGAAGAGIGSMRPALSGSGLDDWRIGFSFLVSQCLMCWYLDLWSRQRVAQLDLLEREKRLALLASTDVLTGLLNRRVGDLSLQELASKKRYSILLLDVDHFKNINDTFGHDAGDTVLQDLARTLQEAVRNDDVVSRWGGEEFLIALGDAPPAKAEEIATQVRRAVAQNVRAGDEALTVSIGVAHGNQGESVVAVRGCADEALYHAKANGRDVVFVHGGGGFHKVCD